MKISVISDLHFECGSEIKNLPGGDVLLIAGDICEARQFMGVQSWLRRMADKYEATYMVLGNHEHYGSEFYSTAEIVRNALPANVTLLDDDVVTLPNGMLLFGGTLWTDMNRRDPMTMLAVKNYMLDFQHIKKQVGSEMTLLQPYDVVIEHLKTKLILMETLHGESKEVIVMTHHLPTFGSVPDRFREAQYRDVNHGFYSDMDALIDTYTKTIPLWVHGHTHAAMDYMLAETRIVCNPRGYGAENRGGFDPQKVIEL